MERIRWFRVFMIGTSFGISFLVSSLVPYPYNFVSGSISISFCVLIGNDLGIILDEEINKVQVNEG